MTTSYIGMDAKTGRRITDLDHIRQSIGTVLTTAIGTRVMRRSFGSIIPDLIDKPLNAKTQMQLMAASVMAINAWEPRIELLSVKLSNGDAASSLYVDITGSRRDGPGSGQKVTLSVPVKGLL